MSLMCPYCLYVCSLMCSLMCPLMCSLLLCRSCVRLFQIARVQAAKTNLKFKKTDRNLAVPSRAKGTSEAAPACSIASMTQYSIAQYSIVQYSIVQYSIVQFSIVQYSIVQYSTVQYSILQYSLVQYSSIAIQ